MLTHFHYFLETLFGKVLKKAKRLKGSILNVDLLYLRIIVKQLVAY